MGCAPICVFAGMALTVPARAWNAPESCKSADSVPYTQIKRCATDLIGRAQERVWVATSYFTDGDVLASLHIAKFRKVDVRVLLEARTANCLHVASPQP